MTPALVLRPATAADDDALLSWIRSPDELERFTGFVPSWPLTRGHLRAFREAPDAQVFTAVTDDAAVGHVELVRVGPGHARIARVIVAPDARGAGLGRALIAAVLDVARSQGLRVLDLRVMAGNAAAIRTYENFGFVDTGPHDAHGRVRTMALAGLG